jgi:hypothetical protein
MESMKNDAKGTCNRVINACDPISSSEMRLIFLEKPACFSSEKQAYFSERLISQRNRLISISISDAAVPDLHRSAPLLPILKE